jgi:hypothetical protein
VARELQRLETLNAQVEAAYARWQSLEAAEA